MDNLLWITEKNAVFFKKKMKNNILWITKTKLCTSKIADKKRTLTIFRDNIVYILRVMHKLCTFCG